jgi:hypothetical protein
MTIVLVLCTWMAGQQQPDCRDAAVYPSFDTCLAAIPGASTEIRRTSLGRGPERRYFALTFGCRKQG